MSAQLSALNEWLSGMVPEQPVINNMGNVAQRQSVERSVYAKLEGRWFESTQVPLSECVSVHGTNRGRG